VLGWHYPSDVVAACTIATGWLALGVTAAGLMSSHRRLPSGARLRAALGPAAAAVGVAAAFFAAAVVARPDRAVHYMQQHTTFVVAAVALGTVALGLVAVTAAALTLIERGASS
jgi:hypothetical protein